MKKIGKFLKKYRAIFIIAILLLAIGGGIGIGLDQKEKHKWEKHPVEPYSYTFVENDDMDLIKNRILAQRFDPALDVTEILNNVNEDGTFSDINYESTNKDYWPPLDHLKHILDLQIAYYSEGNKHYQNPDVKNAVVLTMHNWIENDYKCEWNWWYNDIGAGGYIPDILLFGIDGISKEEQDKLLNNMKGIHLKNEEMFYGCVSRKVNSSGGNLTDKALSTIKVAILQNDGSTLMWVKDLLENELHPFPSYEDGMFRDDCEGIKEDGSFQQHYQLIYFGGYGEVFADGITKYINLTTGTQYALDNESLNLFADFLLDGMQYVTRNGYRDVNASGRGAVRVNALRGISGQVKNGVLALLNENNIARADELQNILDNRFLCETDGGANGHKYFYESDFQVMNNKNYMATVRSASEKTRIYEYLNGENPFAYYTGLGATFYYVKGDEYYNVLPLYDWNKTPGTTVRNGFLPKFDQDVSYRTYGTSTVSGVSNGKIGASFIGLNDNDVTGKKVYFMFDNAVICLGNSLTTQSPESLITTINQGNFNGKMVLGDGAKLNIGENVSGKYSYLYHNNIGFLTDDTVDIATEHISGDWKTVNERKASTPIEGDKFTISIPHSSKENATYAYTVLLNIDEEAAKQYAQNPRYKIISNTPEVQAVLDTQTGTLQAIFHDKGELNYAENKTISVNKPCLVIVEDNNGKSIITASSYNGKDSTVKFNINNIKAKSKLTKKSTQIG